MHRHRSSLKSSKDDKLHPASRLSACQSEEPDHGNSDQLHIARPHNVCQRTSKEESRRRRQTINRRGP